MQLVKVRRFWKETFSCFRGKRILKTSLCISTGSSKAKYYVCRSMQKHVAKCWREYLFFRPFPIFKESESIIQTLAYALVLFMGLGPQKHFYRGWLCTHTILLSCPCSCSCPKWLQAAAHRGPLTPRSTISGGIWGHNNKGEARSDPGHSWPVVQNTPARLMTGMPLSVYITLYPMKAALAPN